MDGALMKDKSIGIPKVLVLTSTFPRWENDSEPAFVYELCRRLTFRFDITVLSPRTPVSKKKEFMGGLRVIRFPYFFQRWEKLAMHGGGILNRLKTNPFNYLFVPFFMLGQLLAIIRLLRQERFDLIHAHWLIPQGFIAVLAIMLSRRRIPLLCTSHGGDLFALHGNILRSVKKWVMDSSQSLTVVSEAMKNTVVGMGIPQNEIQVVSMGVDLRNIFVPDSSVIRHDNELLFVGRLVEKKGVSYLLEALSLVIVKRPNVHLNIAGSGPMEAELRELANQLHIADNVDFLGMVEQSKLPKLYRKAAIAVFPFVVAQSGDQEGFGLVQVEAMGCECPVIAGDLPAIHESITHEESGLLVASGNPEALAETILRALNDRDLCCRMAREARGRVVQRFDWEIIADKYCRLYDNIINKE